MMMILGGVSHATPQSGSLYCYQAALPVKTCNVIWQRLQKWNMNQNFVLKSFSLPY